jgi:apolipoprotein D and lipocalin family protein
MRSAALATAWARLGLLAAIGAWMAVAVATAAPPVRPVERLDLQRYAGIWFEIARLPNKLQERCLGDATTTYTPLDGQTLQVVRRCREGRGRWAETVGQAVAEEGDRTGARYDLSYVPAWLRWWPQTRHRHWVVLLDDGYRFAVVGDPSRKSLWILSRTPSLDRGTYAGILDMLRARKYPIGDLVPTPQRAEHHTGLPAADRPQLMV